MIQRIPGNPGPQRPRMLNIGCGARYHPDWVNIDLSPANDHILQHDLRKPLPFDRDSFQVVYHSHVLEHFSREEGRHLMRECYRVCCGGGIIRIALPDLEKTARTYIDILDQLDHGATHIELHHDWILLELLDQMVRTKPGGEMASFLKSAPQDLLGYLESRIGVLCHQVRGTSDCECRAGKWRIGNIIHHPGRMIVAARQMLFLGISGLLWGREGMERANNVLFRAQGEVHKWMYDRHSLTKLLAEVGFIQVRICDAAESRIPHWASFDLDTDANGNVLKPDSLFCEAVK